MRDALPKLLNRARLGRAMSREIVSLPPTGADRLRRLGVALVYLYGSEAVGRSNALSDIDVGVIFRDPAPLHRRAARADLHTAVSDCLASALTPTLSRELDVVLLQTASPVLQFEAINAGQPLFVDDSAFQANYEAAVIRDYLDVRPLVEMHYQAALERVA